MTVTRVQVTTEVPAGAKAIGDVLVQLAVDIKAKKPTAAMFADLEPKVLAAVALVGELNDDVKDKEIYGYAGVLAGEIAEALVGS